jgi:hypothetical protein
MSAPRHWWSYAFPWILGFKNNGTNSLAGGQFSMSNLKLGNVEKGGTNSLKVALAPALLGLLLIAQFSPAAASFTAKFSLEIGYASFESDGAENYSPDVDPPHFLPASAISLPDNELCLGKIGLAPVRSDVRVSIPAIRAPPYPSLSES